jgi:dCMP deaminase
MGTDDSYELYKDRESKYQRVVHAEMNALLFLRERAIGFTLYTWPFLPCDRCAACVIQAGIARVVSKSNTEDRWDDAIQRGIDLMTEANVIVDIVEWN